jgi:acyl-coenzyme A thioesterase PaaI-like protein
MRKIKNIHQYEDPEKYNCFGCAPHNQSGLKLEFWEDGDDVLATWEPVNGMMGWHNVVHGGIQATLMDEVSGWLVYVKCATAGVTAEMNVKFRKPLHVDMGRVTVRCKLKERNSRFATISAVIERDGVVYAQAELRFFLIDGKTAREQYHYPGVEAFFEA